MKNIRVTIINSAPIAWVARVTGIPRVSGIADVAEIPEVFIYNHVFM